MRIKEVDKNISVHNNTYETVIGSTCVVMSELKSQKTQTSKEEEKQEENRCVA